jgi:hypothetical protein
MNIRTTPSFSLRTPLSPKTLQVTPRFGSRLDETKAQYPAETPQEAPPTLSFQAIANQDILLTNGQSLKVAHFLAHLYERGAKTLSDLTEGLSLAPSSLTTLETAFKALQDSNHILKDKGDIGLAKDGALSLKQANHLYSDIKLPEQGWYYTEGWIPLFPLMI